MNVTVRDGRIARLDEYLDSAHLKPLATAGGVEATDPGPAAR
jgi:hypothetical protein